MDITLDKNFRKNLKEILKETLGEFLDPDYGLEFRKEFIDTLKKSIEEKNKGEIYTLENVKKEINLWFMRLNLLKLQF